MTKIAGFIRRADRAAAIALVLVLATATGAASNANRPSTDHKAAAPQLRGSVTEHIAFNDDLAASAGAQQPILASYNIAAAPSALELAMVKLAAEQRCLAEAMYYEARGEGAVGEEAIAEVIFHRMHRKGYPGTICGVVYQGVEDAPACQFSFVCDGEMRHAKATAAWRHAELLAARILSGYLPLGNATGGATSFHAVDVAPGWASTLERTVQIGNHVFYRPMPRTRAS